MNILPFAGVAAVALLKNRMGSLTRSNYGGYDKNLVVKPDLIRRAGVIMSKLKQLNSIDIGDHKIINLTPHPVDITLKDGTTVEIPRSGGYIRIKLFNSKEEAYGFDNIDVRYSDTYNLNIHFRGHNVSGGESYGLFPTPELLAKDSYFDNVWFLVSRISSHYMNEYSNLLTVGETGLGSREPQKFLSIAEDLCLDKKTGSRSLTDILFLAETRRKN